MADAELIDVALSDFYNKSPPPKIGIEEKTICCVRESDGKTWRRGKVNRVWAAAEMAEVALLDHGRFLVCPLEDVFPLLAKCVRARVGFCRLCLSFCFSFLCFFLFLCFSPFPFLFCLCLFVLFLCLSFCFLRLLEVWEGLGREIEETETEKGERFNARPSLLLADS